MSARFILGKSGSGKTCHCIDAITQALLDDSDSSPLILLVPEQATYQAERAILSNDRIKGYHHLNILSFQRLQFLLLGKNNARTNLTSTARAMIVQRLLREHSDSLGVFSRASKQTGTAQAIAQTITEIQQFGRDADDIDELVAAIEKYDPESSTAAKFRDIALLFKEYTKFTQDKFFDSEAQLSKLSKVIAESEITKGAKVWLDGFAGFTQSELSVLSGLISTAQQSYIALCLDPDAVEHKDHFDPTNLFAPTAKTYFELQDIIKKTKVKLEVPIILDKPLRFSNGPALAHIEDQLFELEPTVASSGNSVTIAAAANARSEAQYVASRIRSLVEERGYRYRDIAIIASDIELYEHYLCAYLDDFDVPYFIDRRKPLARHIIISMLTTALSMVLQGFTQTEVISYLKTGLIPIEPDDIDLLENYCIAYGIGDKDWNDKNDWDYAPDTDSFDNEYVDKIRRKVVLPLMNLKKQLFESQLLEPAQFTKIIFQFLEELKVIEQLNDWIKFTHKSNNEQLAQTHIQFYERFCDGFDELLRIFQGLQLKPQEYIEILTAAFSQMTLALIPPRLDQVLVGNIERSRHPDLKAVFLIGCTQKQFPVLLDYDSVLTEPDHANARSAGLELGPGVRDKLTQRDYLAYIAFTRAAEYLCLSYPVVDSKGKTAVCSGYVQRLTQLFNDLQPEKVSSDDINIENIQTRAQLKQLLCSKLHAEADNKQENKLLALLDELTNDKDLNDVSDTVNSALNYDNKAQLDDKIIKNFFTVTLKASATKLSSFASCPFQYFSRYILKLQPRKEFEFKPLDKGRFYHKILEELIKKLNKDKLDITTIDKEKLLEILNAQIDKLLDEDSFIKSLLKHSKHNAYIIETARETIEDFVIAVSQMIAAGRFRPEMTEADFGYEQDALGEFSQPFDDKRKLILKGYIDRLDIADTDEGKLATIFDYKLSDRTFSWRKFYYGIDMQLAIYMLAVKHSQLDCKPVGAFYIPIENNSIKAKGIFNGQCFNRLDAQIEKGWSKYYNFMLSKDKAQYGSYSISGALKPDDFALITNATKAKIIALADQIIKGDIDVSPYRLGTNSPCTNCDYRSLCRFDWRVTDYRILDSLGKDQVLQKLEGCDGR